ncbi:amidohydrolase family protein [Microbaculum marinum]|uniref:Amidohydrolase family protein n=1 Tax=Microbaculum marinum TaxID=1764581 RepID=A0AAW9RHX0_9HYPH
MLPCIPPRDETKAPKAKAPALSCDCHMHIFGPEADYPYSQQRGFTPPDASPQAYWRMADTLGFQRAVIVQASVYGWDNRRTVQAVEEFGRERARGIVMVNADVDRQTLSDLNDRGIRGTRFITTISGGPTIDNLPGVAAKIAEFGWHIEMYVPRNLWPELLPVVADLPVPVVFDHLGGLSAETDENDPDLLGILRLLESGKCWVKLCGYRASLTGHPYDDVTPLVTRYISTAPERCVWGTDWPHTTLADYMPDDGDLFDQFCGWTSDEAVRTRILVDNPAELYHFPPA